MPGIALRPSLRVEGPNDLHAIAGLIRWHGIDYKTNPLAPAIEAKRGVTPLLDGIEPAIEGGGGRTIGFVLDADDSPIDRWSSIRHRLANADVIDLPAELPADSFVGDSARWKSRVGVWLMPDNRRPGALEHFLRELIAAEDPIIEHARVATEQAAGLGAPYPPNAASKAILHTWLAWQEKPGQPYGTAITARCFRHDHPVALRFVNWFRELYRLPTAT